MESNKNNKSSPKNGQQQRSASREVTSGKNVGGRGIPIPFNPNESGQDGMNSLLKSPIKKNLHQVPIRQGQTGSAKLQGAKGSSTSVKGAVVGDHSNAMIVTPSAFV